ncbi:MAG: UvrD-helicase domain-containing protein [Calditrichae bacterium]|nr:UvrD-helicase domain-containing protein [Calditrichia bacterium]
MRIDKILNSLNSKQREAVEMPRVPVLMLAGPGTGKTRTLIARIIYQVSHFEIAPEHILALTFSNKAAMEIRHRLEDVLREKAAKIRTGTIHSFCLEILRKYYQPAGLDPHFTVCNDEYQVNLLNSLVSDKVRSNKDKVVRGILTAIDHFILQNKPLPAFSAMIYDQYIDHLTKHKLIDYNQILAKTRDLLKSRNDICEQYRFLYQAIHIDEFQDTDNVQYQIIKTLAEKHRNIFVVADDDQSIYAWRGANPENIRTFMQDFNIEKAQFLDINYRSGQKIIEAAHSVVENTGRIEPDKKLRAGDLINDSINTAFFNSEEEELDLITEKLKSWSKEKKVPFSEMAVLYPQHRFADKLAVRLIRERIPFQQATGKNLTDEPQMKKIIFYLQAVRDPLDSLILEQLVESELGYNIHKQVQNIQRIMNVTYRRALYEMSNRKEISEDSIRKLNNFIGNLANLVNLKSFFTFNQLLQQIINGLQDLDKTYIEEHAPRFSAYNISANSKWFKHKNNVWCHHSDNHGRFIAEQMLETLFPENVKPLINMREVQKTDTVFLLSATDSIPDGRINKIYEQQNDRRLSVFSTLLRWCQSYIAGEETIFNSYVVFDLETTGRDPESCKIVEIAAVKVRDKKIVDQFQTLVNPEEEIDADAQSVHHISNEDVKSAPVLSEIWPKFKEFIGNDLLIAHNGYSFDFRIIDRFARQFDSRKLPNIRYDSLILARQMYPNDRNSIDALSAKFKLDPGNRHRALDDVKVLHEIFQVIISDYAINKKNQSADFLFEYVALANFINDTLTAYEDKVFFLAGVQKLLSPYSKIFDRYCLQFAIDKTELSEKIAAKARQLYPGIQFYNNRDDFKQRIFNLSEEFNRMQIDKAIAEFLSTLMLLNPQDSLAQVDAVSLLTFHAAKGLEFRKVIIMGMEDESMPSFFAYKEDDFDDRSVSKKIDEQKRLLYVGLTRAKEEILFTAVKNRFGRDQRSSPFLREILKFIKKNG